MSTRKISVRFSGEFRMETELPPDVARGRLVHKLEKFLRECGGDDLSLTVATIPEVDPNLRYWEAYVGGARPVRVSARTEWEAKEELRQRLGRRKLPSGTTLVEITGSLIQGDLF